MAHVTVTRSPAVARGSPPYRLCPRASVRIRLRLRIVESKQFSRSDLQFHTRYVNVATEICSSSGSQRPI